MPFVQGHLRGKPLSVVVSTECGHCGQSFEIEIDSTLRYEVRRGPSDPLVYAPLLDLHDLDRPSIIDDF